MFKFELGWLLRDGFTEMVKNIWLNENAWSNLMEKWKAKIRRLGDITLGAELKM
jgi:hypothetical protein